MFAPIFLLIVFFILFYDEMSCWLLLMIPTFFSPSCLSVDMECGGFVLEDNGLELFDLYCVLR